MSADLIQALRRPGCYRHACDAVEVIETHLSWVLLAGPYAYKVKKPVNLGFADFSTLPLRGRYCREELRLNRRLAPQLYHRVVAITGTREAPRMDGPGALFEYAVRMARFPQQALATHLLREGRLDAGRFDALAQDIAAFHEAAPQDTDAAGYGAVPSLAEAMRDNFAVLREPPGLDTRRPDVEVLARWSTGRLAELTPTLRRRKRAGFVRECHGDLHLGNLALLDGRLVPFDCIEFNPALRWIDTASEVAFTVMDLRHRGAPALAHRFLSAYLEASGDYEAVEVLDWFLAYRALVRAKVAVLRAQQCGRHAPLRERAIDEAREHVTLALEFTRRSPPALVITHGVSGSGKTTLAQALVDEHGMIRVRSDIERKRLFGPMGPRRGLYAAATTARTYAALEARARTILQAGHGAVVDATFLRRDLRRRFAQLARELGCEFRIVAAEAPAAALRQRVLARLRSGSDASDATPAVLEAQLAACEALAGDEAPSVVRVDTRAADAAARLLRALRLPRASPRREAIDVRQCEAASSA